MFPINITLLSLTEGIKYFIHSRTTMSLSIPMSSTEVSEEDIRFRPSAERLIGHYLYRKIYNPDLHDCYFAEMNVYGDIEPWNLWNSEDAAYFFSPVAKMASGSSRINRKIGSGRWVRGGKGREITIPGMNFSGIKKTFHYENEDSPHHRRWTMLEYSIEGYDQMVICCIKKRRNPKSQIPARSSSPQPVPSPMMFSPATYPDPMASTKLSSTIRRRLHSTIGLH